MIEGVPDYHDSPIFQQLWDALGSKLIETARGHLTFNQGVTGSRPVRPSLKKEGAGLGAGRLLTAILPGVPEGGCDDE